MGARVNIRMASATDAAKEEIGGVADDESGWDSVGKIGPIIKNTGPEDDLPLPDDTPARLPANLAQALKDLKTEIGLGCDDTQWDEVEPAIDRAVALVRKYDGVPQRVAQYQALEAESNAQAARIAALEAALKPFAGKEISHRETRTDDYTIGVPIGWLRDARAALNPERT